jgi:molecular chaperone GrpE
MPEQPSPSAAGNAAEGDRAALTPEAVEALLADFRAWLAQPGNAAPPPDDAPDFDWHTLVAEFTALRHEVNLQTRAARAQSEQSADALDRLGQALDALEQAGDESSDDEATLRPLLKTLVDVYDALALAEREVERVQAAVEQLLPADEFPAPEPRLDEPHPPPARKRPWWRWWSAGGDDEGAALLRQRLADAEVELTALRREQQTRHAAADQVLQFLTSVLSGYKMSLQRIDRVLEQHGLETIACVGLPFDPEAMEVVEVVRQPGRAGTEVLQEVRRGYRWRDRLFRFAQVRVARP